MPSKRVILDTDTGVDDALAILLAMRSPELHVEAITAVSGNIHIDHCIRNIPMTLEVLGKDTLPEIARGEDKPLKKPLDLASHVHGDDGLGGVTGLLHPDGTRQYPDPITEVSDVSAVDLILHKIEKFPNEITLIAVGPLTNIAKAVLKAPDKMKQLHEIVIMGGAFRDYGNVSPVAEFNIFVDPHAAQIVCDAGIPLVFVPLDVTMQAILTASDVDRYASEGGHIATFVQACTAQYIEFHRQRRNIDGCFIHDALAVVAVFQPELFTMVDARVNVETTGQWTSGMTVADLRSSHMPPEGPNAQVCIDMDVDAFMKLFIGRVLA